MKTQQFAKHPIIMHSSIAAFIAAATALAVSRSADANANTPSKLRSFIPKENVARFIVDNLDLTTFTNSFGPQRAPGLIHFADFKVKPTSVKDPTADFDLKDWWYRITINSRGDTNGDGIEDLVVEYWEKSNIGTYRDYQQLVLTKRSKDGRLVVIKSEGSADDK